MSNTSGCTNFDILLDTHDVLVADGAMGTALFELGLQSGGCPELLNVEQPDLIAKVHRGYVEAGADVILTNTFGGNRSRLALHKLADRVAELNRAAVDVARQVAASVERPIAIAGSIGPTGDLFEPLGPLTHEVGVEIFSEQAAALIDEGVDVLWIETISSTEELKAATEACSGRGVPVVATLSFDTNGHTMMGIAPQAFAEWWTGSPSRPTAIGANCGVGPSDVVQAAGAIRSSAPGAIVIAKGNCGIPLYKDEALTYPSGPEDMVAYTELAVRSGARIVGACCGSGFDHIAAIRRTVDAGIEGPVPESSEIAERLGEVSAPRTAPDRQRRRRQ
ncbi:MAG: betaine--homocysteine S-methyltransferase [Acidimicrobiia bacterium]|nr:betaine--homocysteine S-methyltransferase [Acidimicrobiia bacterium]